MKRRQLEAGLTLIEMMIAVLISMVLSVAVMFVMSGFEGRRRTLGSTSDLDQQGTLAMYQMDRWIRSAGTGLVQGNSYAYGCKLFAANNSTQILPTSTLPAPFTSVPGSVGAFRLAPVMILPGQTTPNMSGQPSDVLVLMSSGNDASQVPSPFQGPPTATQLSVSNTSEFSASDLLLIADQQPAAGLGPKDCLISQAAATLPSTGIGTALPLGSTGTTYYSASVGTSSVASFTSNAVAFDLGAPTNSGTGLPPSFLVIGVGDNDTLYSYDLLNISNTALAPLAQAEGVFELHAVYGVDSNGDNKIDQWVNASTSSAYSVSALSAGTPAATLLLKNIRAVRVALIMRTALPDKSLPSAGLTLTMFSDLGLTVTRSLSATEQQYRYRVIETTIPVRNNNY